MNGTNSITWSRKLVQSGDLDQFELLVTLTAVALGASTGGAVRLNDQSVVRHLGLGDPGTPRRVFDKLVRLGWVQHVGRDVQSGRDNYRMSIATRTEEPHGQQLIPA